HIRSYAAAVGTDAERALSLATPLGMAVSSDGSRLYLAAFGSQRIAWDTTGSLSDNSFQPAGSRQIRLSAGGQTGLLLEEARKRLYALTRLTNGNSTVDLATNKEIAHQRMYNPEPAAVTNGRRFLYDARLTSSRGDSSCSGCHVFGDMDHL